MCLVEKLEPINISCIVETKTLGVNADGSAVVAPTVTVSGTGDCYIGDTVTLTMSYSGGKWDAAHEWFWYYKNESGTWVNAQYRGTNYIINFEEGAPTEYKLEFIACGMRGVGD